MYQKLEDGHIQNIYNIQLVNKTAEDIELSVRLKDQPRGLVEVVGEEALILPAKAKLDRVFIIKLPQEQLKTTKTELSIQLWMGEQLIDEVNTNFLGPVTLEK